jgi:hypothetical protein
MRTTVDLDAELHVRLRRLVPERGLNRFINQAVAEKVAALEQQEIERAMIEGYVATRGERADLNADWDLVDTVDWPA